MTRSLSTVYKPSLGTLSLKADSTATRSNIVDSAGDNIAIVQTDLKQVTIYYKALPANPTPSSVKIYSSDSTTETTDDYRVQLANEIVTNSHKRREVEASFEANSSGLYTYTAGGSTAGFYNNTTTNGISYASNINAENFTINGLATGLTIGSVGSGKAIELIDAGNNLTYVKVNRTAIPNGSTTAIKGDIVLTDSNGYWDGKLFALMLDSTVPQPDSNGTPPTLAAASLTFDSVEGTATYTGTTYDEYYYRMPTTLPAAESTETYVTTAKYYDHAGGESFLISGLNYVDGISQQLVAYNITVTETKTLDTLTGAINVNYNFSIGSALKSNLQSGKYIIISSRDTQNFSPTIVTKE